METVRIRTIDSVFYRELGKTLRHYREKRNLTLKELSKKTGFSRPMLDHWELGANKIKPYQLDILCEALDITNNLCVDVKLGFGDD